MSVNWAANVVESEDIAVFVPSLHQRLLNDDAEASEQMKTLVQFLLYNRKIHPDKRREWLLWLSVGTEPEQFLSTRKNTTGSCGRVWQSNELAYFCRQCQVARDCGVCEDCFQKSDHTGHDVSAVVVGAGGCCDCGDEESWAPEGNCSEHGQKVEDPLADVPPRILKALPIVAKELMSVIVSCLAHVNNHSIYPYTEIDAGFVEHEGGADAFTHCTLLYNDEIHTYEQVERQLELAVPGVSRTLAHKFAQRIDGMADGIAIVRVGTLTECTESRDTLTAIALQSEVRPLRHGHGPPSTSGAADAWTVFDANGISALLKLVLELARDAGMTRLLCAPLVERAAPIVPGTVLPTFVFSGTVELDLDAYSAEDGEESDETDADGTLLRARRAFTDLLVDCLELPENSFEQNGPCQLSFWCDEGDEIFRARISAPPELQLGARLGALKASPTDELLIDEVEQLQQTKPLSQKAGDEPTQLCSLMASHAGQTIEMKKLIGEWYFALWAKDNAFKQVWAEHLVSQYEGLISELGRVGYVADSWSLLSFTIQVFHQKNLTLALIEGAKLADTLFGLLKKKETHGAVTFSRVVSDINRVLRVPGILEHLIENRSDLCISIIECLQEVVHRKHSLVRRPAGEPHVEFQEKDWVEPFKRNVFFAPVVCALTQRLLRPGVGDEELPSDDTSHAQQLTLTDTADAASVANAKRLAHDSFLALIQRALDVAWTDTQRVLKGRVDDHNDDDDNDDDDDDDDNEVYDEGAFLNDRPRPPTTFQTLGNAECESLVPLTMLHKHTLLSALKAQHPELQPSPAHGNGFDAYARDSHGYRCPICADRAIVDRKSRPLDAVMAHVAQKHLNIGVSFLLPMERFVALACRQRAAATELLLESDKTVKADREALRSWLVDDQRALMMLEAGCQTFVARAESAAGLWKLSGDVMPLHVRNWCNQTYRVFMLDLDVLACQTAMCVLPPDHTLSYVLHRFGVLRWVRQAGDVTSMSDTDAVDGTEPLCEKNAFANDDQQRVFLTRLLELLRFLVILCEDKALITHTSLEQRVEDEIVHRLWLAPAAHSALCSALAYTDSMRDLAAHIEYDAPVSGTGATVKRVLARVATLRPATAQHAAAWALKPEYAEKASPYHRLFDSKDAEKADELSRARKKASPLSTDRKTILAYQNGLEEVLTSAGMGTVLRAVLRLALRRGSAVAGVLAAAIRLARLAQRAGDGGDVHNLAALLAKTLAHDDLREARAPVNALLDALPSEVTVGLRRTREQTGGESAKDTRAKDKRRRMKEKIMARMKRQQAAFASKNNGDDAAQSAATSGAEGADGGNSATTTTSGGGAEKPDEQDEQARRDAAATGSCILCRASVSQQGDDDPLGVLCYVQRSRVAIHHNAKHSPIEQTEALTDEFRMVITSCEHLVHQSCRSGYLESLYTAMRRRQTYAGAGIAQPQSGQMLCPLCQTLSNVFVPRVPMPQPADTPAPVVSFSKAMEELRGAVAVLTHATTPYAGSSVPSLQPIETSMPAESDTSSSTATLSSFSTETSSSASSTTTNKTIADTTSAPAASAKLLATLSDLSTTIVLNGTMDDFDNPIQVVSRAAADSLEVVELAARGETDEGDYLARAAPLSWLLGSMWYGAHEGAQRDATQLQLLLSALSEAPDASLLHNTPLDVWLQLVSIDVRLESLASLLAFLMALARVITAHAANPSHAMFAPDAAAHDAACASTTDAPANGALSVPPVWQRVLASLCAAASQDVGESQPLAAARAIELTLPVLRRVALARRALFDKQAVPSVDVRDIDQLLSACALPPLLALGELLSAESQLVVDTLSAWWATSRAPGMPPLLIDAPLPFSLMPMPESFTDVLRKWGRGTCLECDTVPTIPALCLTCSTLVCLSPFSCCQVDTVSEVMRHAEECGAGTAIYLVVNACIIVITHNKKLASLKQVYLDEFGDESINSNLLLNESRLRTCVDVMVNHSVHRHLNTTVPRHIRVHFQ